MKTLKTPPEKLALIVEDYIDTASDKIQSLYLIASYSYLFQGNKESLECICNLTEQLNFKETREVKQVAIAIVQYLLPPNRDAWIPWLKKHSDVLNEWRALSDKCTMY